MPEPARSLLILSRVPGVGVQRLGALMARYADADAIFDASPRELCVIEGIEKKTALAIAGFRRGAAGAEAARFAEEQLRRLDRAGGRCVTLWDGEYPPHLRTIYDPPPLLFVQGTIEPADSASLALVGTRSPGMYGLQAAQRFAAALARLGVTVVSGLARGIDTAAHAAALDAGGRTLAVIGSGIDVPYPPENRSLAARIAAGGAVVSEYPMGTKPEAGNFPRRNRIISGITLGTVVLETGIDGGAMITARMALDQNREVFAFPAAVREGKPAGTNRLIREGKALLVESVDDVVAELGNRLGDLRSRESAPAAKAAPVLTLFEQGVYEAVPCEEPAHVDVLAGALSMPVAELLAHLLALECKGLVRQLPGKYFVRS